MPEGGRTPRSAFSVEPGQPEIDPKVGAARGWAKLRATVKSARFEAQGTVSLLRQTI